MIPDAVVETSPEQIPAPADRELQYRLRQQELLAQLGVLALQRADFDELLHAAARLVAEGLLCRYCKVLEILPDERKLLVRAGVGWGAGVVGVSKIGADLDSPAGFALHTGLPVISNHLEQERRFRTPALLVEPICLSDFPIGRSQRSDHLALPENKWSRGSLVPPLASSLSIVEHRSQLIGQKSARPGRKGPVWLVPG